MYIQTVFKGEPQTIMGSTVAEYVSSDYVQADNVTNYNYIETADG